MRLYRVENPDTMDGLWYDGDGNFTEYVKTLDDGQCRELPMPFNPEIAGGWFSACPNIPDMQNWFSHTDLLQLEVRGYNLYEVLVPDEDCRLVDGHAVFTRERAALRKLPMVLLDARWDMVFDPIAEVMAGIQKQTDAATRSWGKLFRAIDAASTRKQLIHNGKKP